MKITVKELRCLVEYIHGTHSEQYEESSWYLRNIYNTLRDIKETMEESDVEMVTQPPVTTERFQNPIDGSDDLPF